MLDPVSFQLPHDLSTHGEPIDTLFGQLFWISVAFFVGIVGAMIYWSWKYRARPGHKAEPTGHNITLEIAWTVAPIVLLVWLFHEGFKGYMELSLAPADSIEIQVKASQWSWQFVYPNGESDDKQWCADQSGYWCKGEPPLPPPLHVPVGKPVKLLMSSSDVIHAFYVPELRTKRDIVPNMYTSLWFKATKTTDNEAHQFPDREPPLDLFCAEYCGGESTNAQYKKACADGNDAACKAMYLSPDIDKQGTSAGYHGHFSMRTKVIIDTWEDWNKYVQGLEAPPGAKPDEIGAKLYKKRTCYTCHSTDGSAGSAPTWKGLFGREEKLATGETQKVDENYIRESILEPNAKIVSGYPSPSPMPKLGLKDSEIDSIIAYIKTLK